jgi:ABC-2 type transport system permease protein
VFLRGPIGLGWRQTGGMLIGWTVGVGVIGLVYGAVTPELESFIADNPTIEDILKSIGEASLVDNYIAMINAITLTIAAVPLLLVVLRMRREEIAGRNDQLLALPLSRTRLFGAYLIVAFLASLVMPVVTAVGLHAGAGVSSPGFGTLIAAAAVYLPALWTMIGVAALLVGAIPKLAALAWALFGYGFFVLYFGMVIPDFPQTAVRLSPFGNIPQLPVQDMNWPPLLTLTGIAAALSIGALFAYRRRDA